MIPGPRTGLDPHRGRTPIRVLLVDDQEILRRGLRMLLELEPGIEVVGEAEDGRHALALLPGCEPDVVLVDARMPVLDGAGFIERCRRDHPHVRSLVLTTFDDVLLVRSLIEAGANGFLLKDVSTRELKDAVMRVVEGGTVIDPRVALPLIEPYSSVPTAKSTELRSMTDTERAVVSLLAEGHSNGEIAAQLHLAHGTVKNAVSSLLRKFNAPDRTRLALLLAHKKADGSADTAIDER